MCKIHTTWWTGAQTNTWGFTELSAVSCSLILSLKRDLSTFLSLYKYIRSSTQCHDKEYISFKLAHWLTQGGTRKASSGCNSSHLLALFGKNLAKIIGWRIPSGVGGPSAKSWILYWKHIHWVPAHNEFGYYERSALTSNLFYLENNNSMYKKFKYNEHYLQRAIFYESDRSF